MGFLDRVVLSYRLLGLSFKVLLNEKYLILFSLFSTISFVFFNYFYLFEYLGIGVGFDVREFLDSEFSWLGFFGVSFLFYVCYFFVKLFFESCQIVSIYNFSKSGVRFGFFRSIWFSFSKIFVILKWAVLNSVVFSVLDFLEENFPKVFEKLSKVLGVVWKVVTLFGFTGILIDRSLEGSVWKSLKKSPSVLKKSWAEVVITGFSVGLIFVVLTLVLFLVCGYFGYQNFLVGNWTGVYIFGGVLLFGFLVLYLLSDACFVVVRTLLYVYFESKSLLSDEEVKVLEELLGGN